MSGFVAFTFTDQQKTDIRRFCGFPAYGDGSVVFPFPWIMRQYLALEYRLSHMSQSEGNVVINTYLANLYSLENAILGASENMGTEQAAVWTRNKNEQRDRDRMFDSWRRRLCGFIGIDYGPALSAGGVRIVV